MWLYFVGLFIGTQLGIGLGIGFERINKYHCNHIEKIVKLEKRLKEYERMYGKLELS